MQNCPKVKKQLFPYHQRSFELGIGKKGSTLNVYDCWAYLPVPLARRLKVKHLACPGF
jgi:hypothetical protein